MCVKRVCVKQHRYGSGHSRRLDLLPLGVPFAWRRWACCVLVLLEGWWLENLLPCLLPFSTMFLDSPIYFIPAGHLLKVHLAYVCLAHHVVWYEKRGLQWRCQIFFLLNWTDVVTESAFLSCALQLFVTGNKDRDVTLYVLIKFTGFSKSILIPILHRIRFWIYQFTPVIFMKTLLEIRNVFHITQRLTSINI